MKFFLPIAMLIAGAAAAQQNPPQNPPQQQQQQNDSVTVVGCLSKGAAQNQYTITDAKTGEKYDFKASQQLDAYINHTVQLTGTMAQNDDQKSFQPATIRTVANSCENPK
jgi:hypothetical protein